MSFYTKAQGFPKISGIRGTIEKLEKLEGIRVISLMVHKINMRALLSFLLVNQKLNKSKEEEAMEMGEIHDKDQGLKQHV